MVETSTAQFSSSPDLAWRGSAAADLEKSMGVQFRARGRTESAALENLPEASPHLMELLEETDRLMNEVQTVLRRVGVELKRLGVSPSMLPPSSRPPACPELDSLSPRESEVVKLLVEGHRVSAIAGSLFISQHTVRNHLQSVYRKLGVSSQAELIGMIYGSAGPSLVPTESPSCG